jgi:hypothetical protein
VTPLTDHLPDETLSALLDAQLAADQEQAARAHLHACSACERRLAGLRSVVVMLRSLPEVEPPRDFALGPRPVAEPANVIRLQRWYTWSRGAAASLAAVFVLLVGGNVYLETVAPPARQVALESSTSVGTTNQAAAPASAPAPAPAAALKAEAPQPPPAAPSKAGAVPPAAQSAADAAPRSSLVMATPDPSDQVKAATRVTALATPTAAPAAQIAPDERVARTREDPAAPFRVAASVFGVLAALAVLGALVVRHRLRNARSNLIIGTQE